MCAGTAPVGREVPVRSSNIAGSWTKPGLVSAITPVSLILLEEVADH